jgi:16S rRNA (adenine1518-N6/adenine1519-N6)-dimethyltransferase
MYRLKKSLGQHFLKDENISKKIVASLQAHPFHQLVEVGPGAGALTKYLLQLPVDFKAVEVDDEKVEYLLGKYPSIEGKIIHESILDIDPPFTSPFTIIGNFPYNISSQIVFKVLEWKSLVVTMIGMFQKEVAQRIVAPPGSKTYGVLSVLTQAFFKAEYLFEVSEHAFNPPPKVKSAVIRLTPTENKLSMKSEGKFFLLVKTAFNQRRKTLRNAVKPLFDEGTLVDQIFNQRAEQLSPAQFAELTHKMKIQEPKIQEPNKKEKASRTK